MMCVFKLHNAFNWGVALGWFYIGRNKLNVSETEQENDKYRKMLPLLNEISDIKDKRCVVHHVTLITNANNNNQNSFLSG